MSKPILALIPSGYKTSKVYSILPNDASGDFDFSRASVGTRVRKDGLIEEVADNVPRLDWLNSDCQSLKLEPQRTNLQVYSEQFDNSAWTKANSTIEANSIISPNGELSADKLVDTTTSASKYIQDVASGLSTSSEATFSIFLKQSELSQVELLCAQNVSPFTNWARVRFDVSTLSDIGTIIGDFAYEDFGNGWIRLSITGTPVSTSAIIRVTLSKDGTTGYAGSGTEGIYIFGAQVEQGDYSTSYIKTEGDIETRLADVCNNAGTSDLFNDAEGVLYAEIAALADDLTFRVLSVSDGSNNNTVKFGYRSDSNRIYAEVRSGASSQAFLYYDVSDITDFNKVALKYKANDFALWVNGVERATDTSGSVSISLDTLNFDNGGGANDFYGKVKDVRYFDRALTDAELTELTT